MILPVYIGSYAVLTMRNRENITVPVNPCTHRPCGYAFVTISTSDEADHAMMQLSGSQILERPVSVVRARAEETRTLDSGAAAAQEAASATRNDSMEGYRGNGIVEAVEKIEDSNLFDVASDSISPQDLQAAPPVNWNAVNTTKIRTTLGGGVGKARDLDKPSLIGEGQKENGAHSRRVRGEFFFLVGTVS